MDTDRLLGLRQMGQGLLRIQKPACRVAMEPFQLGQVFQASLTKQRGRLQANDLQNRSFQSRACLILADSGCLWIQLRTKRARNHIPWAIVGMPLLSNANP